MTRAARLLLWGLLAASASAAEAPTDPWLRASAHLDRTALAPGQAFRAAVVLEIDAGYHTNANPPSLEFQIPTRLAPEPHPAVRWGNVVYPPGEPFAAEWTEGKPVRVYGGRTVLLAPGTVADDAPLGPLTLRFRLSYQGCDSTTCYQPGERLVEVSTDVVAPETPTAPTNPDLFAPAAPAAPVRFEGEVDIDAWQERGLAAYLGLLVVMGLALNLTPCIFPLIPVTMNFFAAQGESRPRKVLPLALVYALGLALAFAAVGVLAAVAGQRLGLVLETPWGVLGVVTVLAVMMASTFGAFEIQLPSGAMGRLGGRRGLVGAAFMGMVMGVIATPCVGPFLVSLITSVARLAARKTLAQALGFGAVSFFAVGLGLGLPFVVLGMFTSLINRFPRGGPWLVWTKRLLGMGLAGLILYFLEPYIDARLFWPLVLGLALFAAVYLGVLEGWSRRPFTRRFWAVRLATAAALAVAGVAVYAAYAPAAGEGAAAPAPDDRGPHLEWDAWQEGALERAAAEGRAVLLYFGADWCAECRVWKRRLFADPEVIAASRPLARLYVDVTERPTGRKLELSERFRGTNPPAVIVLDAAGTPVKAYRDPPRTSALVEALRQAAGAGR